MELQNIIKGTLIKRYKRFLADIRLDDGNVITAHCPNSGSMLGLKDEGLQVYVRHTPKEDGLQYKLEFVQAKTGALVCINTLYANKVVAEALQEQQIEGLFNYETFLAEQKFVEAKTNTRFDFKLENIQQKGFLEVKSVTLLREEGLAEFPDAKTDRGSKHLIELMQAKQLGYAAYNLYLVLREDVKEFSIAKDIDPAYYNNFIMAKNAGVGFLCYGCKVSINGINFHRKIDIKY